MNLFFKDPRTVFRMREGPLGQYIDSYAAEIRAEGYAHGSAILVPIHTSTRKMLSDVIAYVAGNNSSGRLLT